MKKYLPIIIIVCILIVAIIVFELIVPREADNDIVENITPSPTIILDSETTNKSLEILKPMSR